MDCDDMDTFPDHEEEVDEEEEEDDESSCHPTHRLKDIKAGDHSVQLLMSTKDHLYEAENVEVGTNGWQVIGAWDESTIPELHKMMTTRRQVMGNRGDSAASSSSTVAGGSSVGSTSREGEPSTAATGLGSGRYGGGQRLGQDTKPRSPKERNKRQ